VQYGAIARALGVSRSSLRQADEQRVIDLGMEPGGVSPICSDPDVVVVVDESVVGMGSVYCGGGTSTTTIAVDASAIVQVAVSPIVAAIAKE
jgi:Cys-tRNA(Pro)/Cys-tRNA(Cys) deacylase